MEQLTKLESYLTAKPVISQKKAKSSISINIRRFQQSVHRKRNGYETIRKHRLVSSLPKLSFNISPRRVSNLEDIDNMLVKLMPKSLNRWLKKRVSALISSKIAAACMNDGRAYLVKADVDVIFEKRYLVDEIKNSVEEKEEKDCAICFEDLSGGVGCTEIQCSHVFHRDCIWKWLRKKMSCPTCRSCICGKKSCSHGYESD